MPKMTQVSRIFQANKVGSHVPVHTDMQRSQPPPTNIVIAATTAVTNTSTPTSVFQHVIVQPGHLIQVPKSQPSREENAKNNGVLCRFIL